MKRVSKLLLLVLGFSAGLLAGAFIRLGFEIINGRPVSIGGEALLLPLVILLICFGFSLGKEVRVQRNFSKAYERGYDNKQAFVAAILAYHRELEGNVLDKTFDNTAAIDVEAQEIYLQSQGTETSDMDETALAQANTGSKVFIASNVKFVDAMEDLKLTCNM